MRAATERIAEVMTMVAADCEADAIRWDGVPFTGCAVGSQLGEIRAQIAAVANAVKALAEMQS